MSIVFSTTCTCGTSIGQHNKDIDHLADVPGRPAHGDIDHFVDVLQLRNPASSSRRLDLRDQPLRHDRDVDDLADGLQQRTSIGTEVIGAVEVGKTVDAHCSCGRGPVVVQQRACQTNLVQALQL